MRCVELLDKTKQLRVDRKNLRALVAILDTLWQPANQGTLSIVLLPHHDLAVMHGHYCGDSSPTDIITWPAQPADEASAIDYGELCISPQAAVEYVKKHGGSLEQELRRYVIHGYLHLLGYDDRTPAQRRQMRKLERLGLQAAKHIKKIWQTKAPKSKK